jgi:Domain of unknown function (DUF4352)
VRKLEYVNIEQTIKDVYITSKDKKRKVVANYSESLQEERKLVPLKDGDVITTDEGSYVLEISDENTAKTITNITMFPCSEIRIGIKGKSITKIQIIKGLIRISTSCQISIPFAIIRYTNEYGMLWIEVTDDVVSIASEALPVEIMHKKLKKKVEIMFRHQATMKADSISKEPEPLEQKFKDAYKLREKYVIKYLQQFQDKSIDNLYRNLPKTIKIQVDSIKNSMWLIGKEGARDIFNDLENELEKISKSQKVMSKSKFQETIDFLKKSRVEILKEDSYLVSDTNISEVEKVIEISGPMISSKSKKLLEKKIEEFKKKGKPEKKETANSEKKEIAKSEKEDIIKDLNFSGNNSKFNFTITTYSIGKKYKRRELKNEQFLVLKLKIKNISNREEFFFPNEEIKLKIGTEKLILLEDYKLEHDIAPNMERDGELVFIIPPNEKNLTFIFGKVSKTAFNFSI